MSMVDDTKVKISKTKWGAEKTWKFVVEYKHRECLWNSRLFSYKDRQVKDRAYAQLAEMFDCGINDVKIKIKNLRTTYIQEHKKVLESMKTNNGQESTYVPSLVWYNEMDSFLPYISVGKAISANPPAEKIDEGIQIKEETLDIDSENIDIQFQELPLQTREIRQHKEIAQQTGKKRKRVDSVNTQTLDLNTDTNEEHEFDIFGKSVAKQLKSFSSIAAALRVQSKIQSLLTEERIQDQIAATNADSDRHGMANQRFFYNQISSATNWSDSTTVTEVCVLPSSTQDISNLSNESCTSTSLLEDTKEFEVTFIN